MSELAVRGGGDVVAHAPSAPTELVSWAEAASAASRLVTPLVQTDFVPPHFRGNPAAATAAVLYGSEVGMSPLQSLQNIYVISGRPALYARTMVGLVLAAGHRIWTEEASPSRAVVCGQRRGSSAVERVVFTAERARQAGYTKNRKYSDDPTSMLYARAAGECARRVAPDALLGLAYSVEEMQVEQADAGPVAPQEAAPEPPKRTARRRPLAPVPTPDEPPLDDSPAEPAPVAQEAASDPERSDAATPAQVQRLAIAMGNAGITEREARLDWLSGRLNREVTSSKELTRAEAASAINALEQGDAEEPSLDEPEGWS